MDQNQDSKIELKDILTNFYNKNKKKILAFIIIIIIFLISLILLKINSEKKNKLIAEKYVQAGLYLASDKRENAVVLYEEIILKKNRFYSLLALNTVIEKKLISDDSKIIDFFEILEKINYSEEKKDLIIFKKALYLIKISRDQEGQNLLKSLVKKNSKLKNLAKEIIVN